jgi:hypothetical protein
MTPNQYSPTSIGDSLATCCNRLAHVASHCVRCSGVARAGP